MTGDWNHARWRRSGRCLQVNNCVEVAFGDHVVGVRDSKDPAGAVLTFDPAQWRAFLDGVRAGRFGG